MSDFKNYIPWFLKGLEIDLPGIHIKIDGDEDEQNEVFEDEDKEQNKAKKVESGRK